VLIVDDSATIRQLLREILAAEPACQVVGLAANGEEAVRLARERRPDIVTLDLRMPGMDGYRALPEIRASGARVVIVSGADDQGEIRTAVDMMRLGAVSIVPKPQVGENIATFVQRVRHTVVALAQASTQELPTIQALLSAADPAKVKRERPALPTGRHRLVLFGGSTGAPTAMIEVLSQLPSPWSLPVVIAQHIALGFVGGLADWLSRDTGHRVEVARAGDVPRPGGVYLLPVPKGLMLGKGFVFAEPTMFSAPRGPASISPSIDLLFQSAADVAAHRVVGVLFSGMGRDGVKGMRALLDGGGTGLVQDPSCCVVPGIPGAAIGASLDVLAQDTKEIASVLATLGRPMQSGLVP
jgi:two-component system chemotaxis response regulator CheB